MAADNSVFQYSNANEVRVTQYLNSFGEIIAHGQCSVDEKKNMYIPCVPHKYNCKQTKIDSHDMKQTDYSIIIVRKCACLPQHPRLFIFSSRGHDRQFSEQNNQKSISLHNNGEDDKHAHGFADF